MGRGSSSASGRYKGGGNLNPADILSTELITWSGQRTSVENDFFATAQALHDQYGNDAVPQDFFLSATLAAKAGNTIAYYDGRNIALNKKFSDPAILNAAYDECIKQGFHPSRGNKSAAEAVAAHEIGHRLTDAAAAKMGATDLNTAATRIMNEAKTAGRQKGVVQMASKISKYATASNAEAIAEAVSDVYCNGNRAHPASTTIVNVLNSYLK